MTEATTGGPVAGTLAADPAWAQFDTETQGAFKNKGWDTKSPAEAAREALKSYREVESHIGVPKDQILRMPKDAADEAGWKALFGRLGVPADAKGYDFKEVKFADGKDMDATFVDAIAPALLAAGVSKDRAPEVLKAVVKFMDGAEQNSTAEKTAKLATERDKIASSWGPNQEANKFIVKQAVQKLGLTEEIVGALENTAGYANTMQALLKIGQMMGEDKFIQTPPGGPPGVMSREQAEARMKELKGDAQWVNKVNNGDANANREFENLVRLMAA